MLICKLTPRWKFTHLVDHLFPSRAPAGGMYLESHIELLVGPGVSGRVTWHLPVQFDHTSAAARAVMPCKCVGLGDRGPL